MYCSDRCERLHLASHGSLCESRKNTQSAIQELQLNKSSLEAPHQINKLLEKQATSGSLQEKMVTYECWWECQHLDSNPDRRNRIAFLALTLNKKNVPFLEAHFGNFLEKFIRYSNPTGTEVILQWLATQLNNNFHKYKPLLTVYSNHFPGREDRFASRVMVIIMKMHKLKNKSSIVHVVDWYFRELSDEIHQRDDHHTIAMLKLQRVLALGTHSLQEQKENLESIIQVFARGDRHDQMTAMAYSLCYNLSGLSDETISAVEHFLQFNWKSATPSTRSVLYGILMKHAFDQKDRDLGTKHFQSALKINAGNELELRHDYIKLLILNKMFDGLVQELEGALELAKTLKNKEMILRFLNMLITHWDGREHDLEKAIPYAKDFLAIEESSPQDRARMEDLLQRGQPDLREILVDHACESCVNVEE